MKIKYKGVFMVDRGYHQDQSALIIPKAAEQALIHNTCVEDYIKSHRNKYDFMLRAKVPRNSQLVLRWSQFDNASLPLSRITRYFISKTGGYLVKILPPTGIVGTWKRAANIPEDYYRACLAERIGNTFDSQGTPHDPRIHTKNRSVHTIREMEIDKGWHVIECNNIARFDWDLLNHGYYIEKVHKLIDPIL